MEEESKFHTGNNNWEYLTAMRETFAVLRWCWDEFVNKRARRWIRNMLAWSVASRLVSLLYPWLMGVGIDALIQRDARLALVALSGTLATYVVGAFVEWQAGKKIELILGENLMTLDRRINELFFEKELGLHLEENNKLTQTNMEKGLNRFHQIQGAILFGGVDSLNTLFITWGLLVIVSPVAAAIIMLTILGNAWVSLTLNRRIMSSMEPVDAAFRRINRRRGERWEFVERVKTAGQEGREIEEMDAEFHETIRQDRDVWLRYIAWTTLRSLINGFGVTAAGFYAGYQVWIGQSSMAELVPVLTWAGMAAQQMRFLARVEREINWCTPSIKSLRDALMLPVRVSEPADAVMLSLEEPVHIEFIGVSHEYASKQADDAGPAKEVLRNVSFTVNPGEKVALIGPSGAGKSTVTRLIQRFMDPAIGAIRVNGHDLRGVKASSWKRLLAYIPQRAQIMAGTLRDNLLYGLSEEDRTRISDEEIWELMRMLRVDFGSRLTNGLDTLVGRRGVELSGGEAQRVMIGAAAIKKPRFMIIDEATSSLDAEAQAAVQEGLHRILEGDASALIIAHRLSTIMRCDKFVVLRPTDSLKNGESQVEAIACSPQELWRISPTFRRLAQLEGVNIA